MPSPVTRLRRDATAALQAAQPDVRAALPPWVVARVVVALSWVAAHVAASRMDPVPEPVRRHLAQGLLGWDAERYLQIAQRGYEALPLIEIRFFPGLPLLVRGLDVVLPGSAGVALLLVANVSALAFSALVHRLVRTESADAAQARRAAWFSAIAPPAFVMAWGYSEPLWAALGVLAVLCARAGRWRGAALAAAGAALVRPVGLLIAVPLALEALRAVRAGHPVGRVAVAVAAAPVAAASYLVWVWSRFGDPFLPFSIQQSDRFRGRATSPVVGLAPGVRDLVHGDLTIDAVRVVWALALVALLVVCARRWPASYTALAAVSLVAALATARLGSFERYTFLVFPVALALATVARSTIVHRLTLCVAGSAMGTYGALALLGRYVP